MCSSDLNNVYFSLLSITDRKCPCLRSPSGVFACLCVHVCACVHTPVCQRVHMSACMRVLGSLRTRENIWLSGLWDLTLLLISIQTLWNVLVGRPSLLDTQSLTQQGTVRQGFSPPAHLTPPSFFLLILSPHLPIPSHPPIPSPHPPIPSSHPFSPTPHPFSPLPSPLTPLLFLCHPSLQY